MVTVDASTSAALLTVEEFRVLQRSRGGVDASELAARLAAAAGSPETVDARISKWLAEGLLLDESEIAAGCRARVTARPRARIEHLGLMTCADVDLARRGLLSWLDWGRATDRRFHVHVMDDTADQTLATQLHDVLTATAAAYGVPIDVVGLGDRPGMARALSRSGGVDEEIVTFALLGKAPPRFGLGASRNTLLLRLPGACVASADDDVIASFAHTPHDQALRVLDDSPQEQRWFDTAAEAQAAVALRADVDPWTDAEALLGSSVGDVLTATAWDVELGSTRPRFLRNLRDEPVLIHSVSTGLVGDCASENAVARLLAAGPVDRAVAALTDPLGPSREVVRWLRCRPCAARPMSWDSYGFKTTPLDFRPASPSGGAKTTPAPWC